LKELIGLPTYCRDSFKESRIAHLTWCDQKKRTLKLIKSKYQSSSIKEVLQMAEIKAKKRAGFNIALTMLFALLFLLLVAPVAFATMYGDINEDGEIDVRDVVLVQRHVLQKITLTAHQQMLANVKGFGEVDARDVVLIMKRSLKLIDDFPMRELSVTSVQAVNPKQVEVVFDRELNTEEKAKMVLANFHVGLHNAPDTNRLVGTGAAVAVLDDHKTVLLTLGNSGLRDYYFTSGTSTNKVVVKKEVGLDTDYTVTNLNFIDAEVPQLVSVETVSPTQIVMTFSEPLDRSLVPVINISMLSGVSPVPLNLTTPVYVDSQRQLKINSLVNLVAGSYTLSISTGNNLKDYTGFSVVPTSKTFTHTPITTAPTATVKSSTETSVTLEFSRSIDPTTLVGNVAVNFWHTYNIPAYVVNGTAVTNLSGDNKTFEVNFGPSRPLPPGSTTMWMSYVAGTLDASKIKDTWGNIVAPATFNINTVPDTNAPTATVTLVPGSNTQINIQYNKAVTGATVSANYTLRKGVSVVAGFLVADVPGTPNLYRLTTITPMVGTHTLTISNIRDTSINQNLMPTQSFTVEVPDLVPPQVIEVIANNAVIANANQLFVYLTKAMGPSALDPSNYRLVEVIPGGESQNLLPLGTVITQIGSTVKITLPANLGVTYTKLFVGNVKDLAGNSLSPMTSHIIQTMTGFSANPTEVTVRSKTQVSFKVNRHLSFVDASKIINAIPGGLIAQSAFLVNNPDGTATVTATFAANQFQTFIPVLPAERDKISLSAGALTDINGFASDLDLNVVVAVDQAPPVLESATKVAVSASQTRVDVKYSENIYPSSATDSDFTVHGYPILSVITVGDTVRVTVDATLAQVTQITQVGAVEDAFLAPRNVLGPQSAIAVTTP
jgi:hypothetical protein